MSKIYEKTDFIEDSTRFAESINDVSGAIFTGWHNSRWTIEAEEVRI